MFHPLTLMFIFQSKIWLIEHLEIVTLLIEMNASSGMKIEATSPFIGISDYTCLLLEKASLLRHNSALKVGVNDESAIAYCSKAIDLLKSNFDK